MSMQGINVSEASDGESGVKEVLATAPDVAIIDIGLPRMNGYEVAKAIRNSHQKPIQLIALTGYGRNEDRLKALQSGFDAHLVKPMDLSKLLGLIKRHHGHVAAA